MKTLIDKEDYKLLKNKVWMHNKTHVYAKEYLGKVNGKYKYKTILMHRLIVNAPKGKAVDHINGNILDNRKENLRICLNKNNVKNSKRPITNTSGYKGVSWYKPSKKWRVSIYHNKKSYNLGYYENILEAALVYDRTAKKMFGKYARGNFK